MLPTNIMSKTVKVGDILVSKVGVGSLRFACDMGRFLSFSRVVWRNATYVDSKSRPTRPSLRRDQGRDRLVACWCEALHKQRYVRSVLAGFSDLSLTFPIGNFYGYDRPSANLDLLATFYEKYPEYADKTFLSVKGGCDGSEGSLRRTVDNINKHLKGTKHLDLFECARVDPSVPIEETTRTLRKLIQEEEFSYIGMSEASSATIRRAHAVSIPTHRVVLLLILRGYRFTPSLPWRSNSVPGHTRTKRRKV